MVCPAELVCSMYADGALPETEAAALADHLPGCSRCRSLVAAYREENRLLAMRLHEADQLSDALAAETGPVRPVPEFEPPLTGPARLVFAACAAALSWGVGSVWVGLATVTLPASMRFMDPGRIPGLFIGFFVYLSREGYAMFMSLIDAVSLGMLVLLSGWVLVSALKSRSGHSMRLSVCLLAGAVSLLVLVPGVSHAIEVRHSEQTVTVPADEVIDDTLIVAAENASIDGTVNGDLIVVGRRVIVRGKVGGNLVTAGESVTVEGQVGGSVLGFAQTLDLPGASIGGNVYGFGQQVSTGNTTAIDANAVVFGESLKMNGVVGADLLAFGDNLEVSGQVSRDVKAYASRVLLLASARVGGNLTTHTGEVDNVEVLPGAVVTGNTANEVFEMDEPRNRYLEPSFYLGQVMRIGAALLTGLVLFWLVPGLREVSLRTGAQALRATAYGIVTVAALPVLAVILAITLIGIPIAVLVLILWLIALYVAKIVLAGWLGRFLLDSRGQRYHIAIVLLAGLVAVLVLVNIPLVGGALNLVMTLLGLGLIAGYVMKRFPIGQRVVEP